ncbi:pentapeptide repeat-containing protein [Oscillatoria sp. CS-180]|uniref:pentapeptide repeat-containing protein n=1 Tax=Oscillatoria sp. CS-180 TaxID=3021720 RepID=UPI002330FAA4|nr:pentapeptide repeat-containing protein [Oscillatoria sp. CS-180]MDB9528960.1 pentapeptide repeat-containing protein [Oscillatoria sp. CS-180]
MTPQFLRLQVVFRRVLLGEVVNGWLRVGIGLVLGCWLWMMNPASGWAIQQEPEVLTLERLQERVEHPVQREGKSTIDLRQFTIDLRDANDSFRNQFYRILQNRVQVGTAVANLDLGNSVVQGDLDLQRLSLREPLYGEAFFPLLTEPEQAQLKRDRRRISQLSQLSRSLLLQPQPTQLGIFLFRGGLDLAQVRFEGAVLASDIFFLGTINAQGAQFQQDVNFSESRFSQPVSFVASQFQAIAQFRSCLFFERARWRQVLFQGPVTFQGSDFRERAGYGQTVFQQETNFIRTTFQQNADFGQTIWQGSGSFLKSVFAGDVFLTEARFEAPMNWRQSRLGQSVNLRSAIAQSQLDFGDVVFGVDTVINIAGMDFNTEQAALLGSPGRIGRVLSVPALEGNETLLRNLIRNFRELEQVADANRVEYTLEKLRLRSLRRQLLGVNLNTASQSRLQQIGFSSMQSSAILDYRQHNPFVNPADILDLGAFDLATYVKVRDRIIAQPPVSWVRRLQLLLRCLTLSVLLLTSHYGTSVGLTLDVGLLAIVLSSVLFWGTDRYRRSLPKPIVPPLQETIWMLSSFSILVSLGSLLLLRLGEAPLKTGLAIAIVVIPVPVVLITRLYQQGRFHNQLDTSYLVEDGSARQLRLLIARLPIIPKFPFYRDRYYSIDWEKRRNWLNYYDFSLNNWLKFGFNDIRLRDEDVPGLVTALVWYQWAVGLAYVTLLLWTLSRTIPGLNLLLYF